MENKNIMVGRHQELALLQEISTGLVHNAGWQSINNEVNIDDLFQA